MFGCPGVQKHLQVIQVEMPIPNLFKRQTPTSDPTTPRLRPQRTHSNALERPHAARMDTMFVPLKDPMASVATKQTRTWSVVARAGD